MRTCRSCNVEKELKEFERLANDRPSRIRRYTSCHKCRHKSQHAARWASPEDRRKQIASSIASRRRSSKFRDTTLRRLYGIGLDEKRRLWENQDRRCAICSESVELIKIHVDHRHGDGKIRGLLCTRCNPGLGMFLDSPDLLRRAADYLSR